MSMLLMVKAMQTKVGNPLRKLVLLKLADNANDQGECWPSLQYIADQCEISKRSVISHISALCDSGLLKKEHREGKFKANASNLYTLTIHSETPALHSANNSLGGETPALPPSETPAPRISNSLEPVIESVIDPKDSAISKKTFSLPEKLNLDAWSLWTEYRKQQGFKPYKQVALGEGAAASKLIELAGGDPAKQLAIVNQSISNQWKGLFTLKAEQQQKSAIRQTGFTASENPSCTVGKI